METKVTFEEFIQALKVQEWITPGEATRLLKTLDDVCLEQFLAQALKDSDVHIRSQATGALTLVKKQYATNLLLEAMNDVDSYIRQIAVMYFYQRDESSKEITAALIQALADSEINVRYEAIKTLGKVQDKEAIEPLMKFLDDPDIFVRKETAEALALLNAQQAIGTVKNLITTADPDDRGDFILALSKFPELDKSEIDFILSFLNDKDFDVQLCVLIALEKFGKPQHLPLITPFLQSEDKSVKEAAVEITERLRNL